jgi:hypothetical protein
VTSFRRSTSLTAAILTIAAVFFCTVPARAHKTVISPFSYYQDVRPIFERRCTRCHADAPSSPLRFDNAAAATGRLEMQMLAHAVSHTPDLPAIEFDTVMTWAAGGAPEGLPPPGTPVSRRAKRHAPHAAAHGGLLVAIRGDTLHVEGVWAEQRRLRIYVTDSSGDPLPLAQLKALSALVIDAGGARSALQANATGEYLDARIATTRAPARFTVVIANADRPDDRAEMTFAANSTEPPELSMPPTTIPGTPAAMVASIVQQASAANALIDSGRFGALYVPMTHVRDLLLPLARSASAQSEPRAAAIRQLMIATWQLHLDGDNNGPPEVRAAQRQFDAALSSLMTAFAQ